MREGSRSGFSFSIRCLCAWKRVVIGRAGGASPSSVKEARGGARMKAENAMSSGLSGVSDRSNLNDFNGRELNGEYRPSAEEAFMNPRQLEYFRSKLLGWKDAILLEAKGTLEQLQNDSLREPDVTDRASSETDWSIELRTRDRQRKLISKIEAALRRIEEGEYGYCEVTGEPISLARLEARPIATMTVEAQERHERQEKVSRDE
jgi:DnaK suppressor protein